MNQSEDTASSARDADFSYIVQALREGAAERAVTLRMLSTDPLADDRVVPHLKELLSDTTLCVISIPYLYGEIRYLAALALRAEYDALDINDPVQLHEVVRPIDYNEIYDLAAEAGIIVSPPYPSALEMLSALRVIGKLPLYELSLS